MVADAPLEGAVSHQNPGKGAGCSCRGPGVFIPWDNSFPSSSLPLTKKGKRGSSFISAVDLVKQHHLQCRGGFAEGVTGEIQQRLGHYKCQCCCEHVVCTEAIKEQTSSVLPWLCCSPVTGSSKLADGALLPAETGEADSSSIQLSLVPSTFWVPKQKKMDLPKPS